MLEEFRNEPLTDFSKGDNVKKMEGALDRLASGLGREYDIVIGSRRIKTAQKFHSINPSDREEIVGTFQKGTMECVSYKHWAHTYYDWFGDQEAERTCRELVEQELGGYL